MSASNVWNKAALGGIFVIAAGSIGYGAAVLTHTVQINESFYGQKFREECIIDLNSDYLIQQSMNSAIVDGSGIVKAGSDNVTACAEDKMDNYYQRSGIQIIALGVAVGVLGFAAASGRKRNDLNSPAPTPAA